MLIRTLKWLVALALAAPLIALLWVAIAGWNWARGPLQRMVYDRTGRALVIAGDLKISLDWPAPRVQAQRVSFANPSWATEPQMITVDVAEFTVDLPAIFSAQLVFPEVHLKNSVVFLEQAADGRRTWLLDPTQSDTNARIPIGRLTLDQGRLGYDDMGQKIRIRSNLSTLNGADQGVYSNGLAFAATGTYKGLALTAKGQGGSVLALYDESVAYPLRMDAVIGPTTIKADGTVTSLIKRTAADMQVAVRGGSLEQLFPLLGIALPKTHSYALTGHVLHSGTVWQYEKFSGHIGKSDIAGTLGIELSGLRPFLHGELVSQRLDIEDLGPVVGAREHLEPSASKSAISRVLPDIPFKTERWNTVDADVTLRSATIVRKEELPLENLTAHLQMHDALLTLNPMDFGFAGGHLQADITLDGRKSLIQARASVVARKILLSRLFPTIQIALSSVGEINGNFNLVGSGNSVSDMLATSNGRVALVVANGEVSKLLMEKLGLHLLEILQLTLMGDKTIPLRCGVADFGVKAGVMQVKALVLDTEISTIEGSGIVDLGREQLDLQFVSKTRATSPVALRSPIHVNGPLSNPHVQLEAGRVVARGIGALALGLVNPVLALVPLIEKGPGKESVCEQLIRATKITGAAAPPKETRLEAFPH